MNFTGGKAEEGGTCDTNEADGSREVGKVYWYVKDQFEEVIEQQ